MTFPAIDPPWWGRAAEWAPADRGSRVGGDGKEKRGVRRAMRDAILLVLVYNHLLPLLQVAPLAFGAPFSALALSASKRTMHMQLNRAWRNIAPVILWLPSGFPLVSLWSPSGLPLHSASAFVAHLGQQRGQFLCKARLNHAGQCGGFAAQFAIFER
jgi:hypothetical protein